MAHKVGRREIYPPVPPPPVILISAGKCATGEKRTKLSRVIQATIGFVLPFDSTEKVNYSSLLIG